jgi:PD-(D/E)XK endonuclease
MTKYHPRRQGDLGEAAAIQWLTSAGAIVSFPLFHSPDYDLIAELGGRLLRVQVKTSSHAPEARGRYCVQLATSGGNQSWTGVVRRFDPSRCDFLFVLVADGRKWFIPVSEVGGTTEITVGGSKYSEFQVRKVNPLDQNGFGRSKLAAMRGSADVGESGETVNLVPRLLSGFESHLPHRPPPSGGGLVSRPDRELAIGRTQLSANHQVTIPHAPFEAAELEAGDRLRVAAVAKGRVELTRIEEYLENHLKQLSLAPEDDY